MKSSRAENAALWFAENETNPPFPKGEGTNRANILCHKDKIDLSYLQGVPTVPDKRDGACRRGGAGKPPFRPHMPAFSCVYGEKALKDRVIQKLLTESGEARLISVLLLRHCRSLPAAAPASDAKLASWNSVSWPCVIFRLI